MDDQSNNEDKMTQKAEAGDFYADDVEAEALADNNMDDNLLNPDAEPPVTSGDLEIGDLDEDSEEGQGGPLSYDEEDVPGGMDVNNSDAD